MANMDVKRPRFYIDDISYQLSRGVAQNDNFDVMATGSGFMGTFVTGSEIELFDMKPLNLVTFDTSADTGGHVMITIDKGDTSKKYSFIAILNHNLVSAGGAFRVASSDTENHINVVDHNASAREIQGTEIVNGSVGGSDPYLVTPATNGSTIITFGENDDKFYSIQFEGTDGNFTSTDLSIGCIMIGQYYDMPVSPDLSLKRTIAFDGVKVQESLGGQRYSNTTNHGRLASSTSKSPFSISSFPQNIYGGRLSYDINFSYLSSTDVMPNEYSSIQLDDDAVVEDVFNMVNGNGLPFIFSIDNTSSGSGAESEHIFARFVDNKLKMTQVAHNIYSLSMSIEEEF